MKQIIISLFIFATSYVHADVKEASKNSTETVVVSELKADVASSLKIYAVFSRSGVAYVSLGDAGLKLDSNRTAVEELHSKKKYSAIVPIEGALAEKILRGIGISPDDTISWVIFNKSGESQVQTTKIKKLIGLSNGEEGGIPSVGLQLEGPALKEEDMLTAIGVASIGKETLVQNSSTREPKGNSSSLNTEAFIQHAPAKSIELQVADFPLDVREERLGDYDYIEVTSSFSDQKHLYGYFLRDEKKIKPILDFYKDVSYQYKPNSILIGNWIKDFDHTIYISPNSMGDCGRFVLLKKGQIKVLSIECGYWGC